MTREECIARRDELKKAIDDTPVWGAAVGAMAEELKQLEARLRIEDRLGTEARVTIPAAPVSAVSMLSPKTVLDAIDRFAIRAPFDADCKWLLLDTKTGEPGELVSRHNSRDEARLAMAGAVIHTATPPDFQARSQAWLAHVCEGDATDLAERRARFAEEALELVQSLGMTFTEIVELALYTFRRPAGVIGQEYGGMLNTAAVLAEFTGYDLMGCGEQELARCWDPKVIEKVRGKRSRRHGRGPLPGTEADVVPKMPERYQSEPSFPPRRAPLKAGMPPRPMAEGCCSAVFPCSHQKRDPYSICATCQAAHAPRPEHEQPK